MKAIVDKIKKLDELEEKIIDCILAEIEEEARKILRDNSSLKEFIMGMGVWFFEDNDGDNHCDDSISYDNIFRPIVVLLNAYDGRFKITGESMRFTATGTKITDW